MESGLDGEIGGRSRMWDSRVRRLLNKASGFSSSLDVTVRGIANIAPVTVVKGERPSVLGIMRMARRA